MCWLLGLFIGRYQLLQVTADNRTYVRREDLAGAAMFGEVLWGEKMKKKRTQTDREFWMWHMRGADSSDVERMSVDSLLSQKRRIILTRCRRRVRCSMGFRKGQRAKGFLLLLLFLLLLGLRPFRKQRFPNIFQNELLLELPMPIRESSSSDSSWYHIESMLCFLGLRPFRKQRFPNMFQNELLLELPMHLRESSPSDSSWYHIESMLCFHLMTFIAFERDAYERVPHKRLDP
jgi:hypothetical protein